MVDFYGVMNNTIKCPTVFPTVQVSLYVKGFGAAAVRQSAAMKNFAKK